MLRTAGLLVCALWLLPQRGTAVEATAPTLLTPRQVVLERKVSRLVFSPDSRALIGVVTEQSDGKLVSHLWEWDAENPLLRRLTVGAANESSPEWSPDGRTLAFLSDRSGAEQIYLMPKTGGKPRALTAAQPVEQFHWAPDGRSIGYLAQSPEARASVDPIVADREAQLPRLWIVDIESGRARQISRGSWRIDEFAWFNSDAVLAIASAAPRLNTWNTALYLISLRDGSFSEFARPRQPFANLSLSPDHSTVAVVASREGGPVPHDLYLYSVHTASWQDVSASLDRVVKDVAWLADSTPVVRVLDGFRSVLYRLGRQKPTEIKLPQMPGPFAIAPRGTVAYAALGFDRLPEIFVKSQSHPARQIGELQDPTWKSIRLAPLERFTFPSFDGTYIEAGLMRPLEHADRKYPLVLLVHGGPAASFTPDDWLTMWAQLLAARDYGVLLVQPRGSVGYGERFIILSRADLGGGDFKDLMAALDFVLARGEADAERVGIGGWSYGGEMTERAIGATHRFTAAVAGGGVFDEASEYETEDADEAPMDEWYFGTPWENTEVYARNSPVTYIRSAHTPTLILHGADDTDNPVSQSQALYRALKWLGVETQLVIYPREQHEPREEHHQIDIMQRMLDWFDRFLEHQSSLAPSNPQP
jgi:dipeptidyl aminopeptidase/acylaminoacyl peptidase